MHFTLILLHVCQSTSSSVWIVNCSTLQEDLGREWKQLFKSSQLKAEAECLWHCYISVLCWANILRPAVGTWNLQESCSHSLSKCWTPFSWTSVLHSSGCLLCGGCFVAGMKARDRAAVNRALLWACSFVSLIIFSCASAKTTSEHFDLPNLPCFSNWVTHSPTFPQTHREQVGCCGQPDQWCVSS